MATPVFAHDDRDAGGPTRHVFTVDEYYRLAETGVLPAGSRTELIHGDIIDMSPIGSRHAACVTRLQRTLMAQLRERADVRVQMPIALAVASEPQPDLALVSRRADDYESGHPTPADVLLVIEVSDTTPAFDRNVKASLYAGAGIAEYWLVDVAARVVDVHRAPEAGRYTDVSRGTVADTVVPAVLPDVRVDVSALFGVVGS
jgi:Uma2 family endonuclease